MIITMLLLGLVCAIIGAVPPGASNLAVIKTAVQKSIQEALKIGYGAGFGEVLLAFTALYFGMAVQEVFTMHIWIQILMLIALAATGIYFILKKESQHKRKFITKSKYLTGFVLSLVNPPVLVYWVVAFSFLRSSIDFPESMNALLILMAGVFIGKVVTLYGYSLLGKRWAAKRSSSKSINPIIGTVLLFLSFFQGVKLLLI